MERARAYYTFINYYTFIILQHEKDLKESRVHKDPAFIAVQEDNLHFCMIIYIFVSNTYSFLILLYFCELKRLQKQRCYNINEFILFYFPVLSYFECL